MNERWFEAGREAMLEIVRDQSGADTDTIDAVYSALYNLGLIDYDVEKEVFWDLSGEDYEA